MLAEESLREGDVDTALTHLQEKIKKDPSNSNYRVFLFQLLSVMGQWDRALTQLNVAGDIDAGTLAMVQTYREALRCEALRGQVFAGTRTPMVFGDPEPWIALMVQALALDASGQVEKAQSLREQALEDAPATTGKIDGQEFSWIADADQRLGPILEAIVNGNYYWIPLHRIRSIKIDAPVDLRDVTWMPAYFTWATGGESVGLIPTRYPGSQDSADNQLRLARRTEWQSVGDEIYFGMGQRLLATDTADYALMDIREIDLDTAEADVVEEAGG